MFISQKILAILNFVQNLGLPLNACANLKSILNEISSFTCKT